jgi:retinol dehydrogenase-12
VRRAELLLIGLLIYELWPQGDVVVAKELARRYGDKLVCTSLHPGNIRTDLQRHMSGWTNTLLVSFL